MWYVPGRGCLRDQCWALASLVGNISRVLSQLVAGGLRHILCDSTGRGLLETCTWCPLDSPVRQFPVLIVLCSLPLEHHSYERHHMLSPLSPPSESLNPGWSWGPLTQLVSEAGIVRKTLIP